MNISTETAIYAFTVASFMANGIFWTAFLVGRLYARMERAEVNIVALDTRMDKAGQRMSDLADEVQKLPNEFLTRREALMWRGSRAEDIAP